MINYYEELGIRNDASVEEIRQAYRTLARLLHPDSQTDERLKDAAACQMKRLHEMLDILLDARKRQEYDQSLAAVYPPTPPVWKLPARPGFAWPADKSELAGAVVRNWFWILIGVVLLGSCFWYTQARVLTSADAEPAIRPLDAAVASDPVPAFFRDRAIRRRTRSASRSTDVADASAPQSPPDADAVEDVQPSYPPLAPAPVASAVPERSEPAPLPAAPAVERQSARPRPAAEKLSFAGNWLYVPGLEKPGPHLYPPVYIEFRIAEENGGLKGSYRAQYAVPDRAISSNVLFQAQGESPASGPAALVWTSSDGAAGRVNLELRSQSLLKVTWWTTRFGSNPGLASGTATLIRQQVEFSR